jgi:hypothetical protein
MRKRRNIGNIPDDVGQIEWQDDPSVVKAARDLQHRWHRWLKMKEIIDADWKANAEKELAAVSGEVETGLLLARLEAERIADQTADATTTQKYLDELLAIRDKAWRSQAEQRLAAATRTINADIRKRDSQLRERLRRRRLNRP